MNEVDQTQRKYQGGNTPPPPFAREYNQKSAITPDRVTPTQFQQVQNLLDQYMWFPDPKKDKFPEILGYQRHGVLTQWFHRAPFGQPRGIDFITLRKLAESPFITMCKETRIDQIVGLSWDVIPLEKDHPNDTACTDAYEFLSHPNQNQESLRHVLTAFLNDILDLDAGVLVKTFSGVIQDRQYAVPEAYQSSWGELITKPQPRDYQKVRHKGRILKKVPQGGARLEEFFARDGGSFVKDVDQFGITYGYWQYTYKYPAPAPIPFSDREIVYGMVSSKSFGPYGFSPLQSLQRILGVLITQTVHAEKYYDQGGVPPGILALMNMSVEQFKIWRAYFYEEIAGNPHKIPMINPGAGGDAKWISFAPTNKDLQFLESQEWYLKLVCGVMKVNFNELGITDTINRATSEEQSQVFKRRSLRPLLDLIEWVINLEIMQELWAIGMPDTVFKFVPDIDSFEKARQTTIFTSEAQIGIRTINEIRVEDYGLPEVPWGDVPQWFFEATRPQFNPFQDFPDGLPPPDKVQEQEPREEESEAEEGTGKQEEELTNALFAVLKNQGIRPPVIEALTTLKSEHKAKLLSDLQQGGYIKNTGFSKFDHPRGPPSPNITIKDIPPEEREKLFLTLKEELIKTLDDPKPAPDPEPVGLDSFYGLPNPSDKEEDPRAISPYPLQVEFQRELAELFAAQEQEVLKELGVFAKGVGIDKAKAALDALGGEHFQALLNVVRRFIMRALKRGGNKAHQELKVETTFSLRDEDAERYMQDFSMLLAKSKFVQIRERVRTILVDGLEKGENVYTIAENLQKEFSQMKRFEAKRIARTEVARAMNYGREIGYKRSSLVTHKQWLVAWDDRLCEQCRPLANQIAPLGAEFMAQTGAKVLNPPLHPNCRCTILPIVRKDARKTAQEKYYVPTPKMQKIEKHFEKPLEEILPELLEEYKSLNRVAEHISKEVVPVTVMSLSNWARQLGVETRERGGDTSEFRNKNNHS